MFLVEHGQILRLDQVIEENTIEKICFWIRSQGLTGRYQNSKFAKKKGAHFLKACEREIKWKCKELPALFCGLGKSQ